MIVKQYIKEFEKLGLGMFVHFGLYSVLGKGEWAKALLAIPDEEYYGLMQEFDPKPEWAEELVAAAKNAGCKYVTLTTRHHDGFSLYDTCGLNSLDAMHAKCGRDLVQEFVDACRKEDIIPFFYHTLLDWYQEAYKTDFPSYLKYLRSSVEVLCTNYGKIGGLWFDGMWDKPDVDWEEDALYTCIRKHQPEAMIINNTGLSARGALGHIELDSVTFERGVPKPVNMEGAPKYVASEMCEIFGSHWGYAANDLDYKSPARLIEELAECRKYGANMLINLGPMGDGAIRPVDSAFLGIIGEWVKCFDEAIRSPRPTGIVIENKPDDFILQDGNNYYLFCFHLQSKTNNNVDWVKDVEYRDYFELAEKITSVTWMDDGAEVSFHQDGSKVTVFTEPYDYGGNLVVRVAKICTKDVSKQISRSGKMAVGDVWELEENHVRTGKVLNFCADIDSFDSLSLGHGKTRDYVMIDSDNIYHYKNGEVTETYAHGLKIVNNIQVNITVKDEPNYNAYVTMVSNGIRCTCTLNTWYGNQGTIFAESGSNLRNCKFSWMCRNYNSKVWAFGDSYFGHGGENRWVYYLLSDGYDHCLLDGFAGRTSLQALGSLKADLQHGTPEYLFWALGMNDNDRGAMNENWLSCVTEVLNICERYRITPILATIPNTPTRDNTYKNAFVRESGHRYVDFAKAVGAEELGSEWYGDMLYEDKVHPNPTGAAALYQQVLCDFPEITLK